MRDQKRTETKYMPGARVLLRAGLAFVFFYVGFSTLQNPSSWIGFVPPFIERFISPEIFLQLHAWLDIGIGMLLVWGRFVRIGALLAFIALVGISVTNIGARDIIFRDIGLALSALALFVMYKPHISKKARPDDEK